MQNEWSHNTKARVAMAAGQQVADAVPDRLYQIMGGVLVYFWERSVLEPGYIEMFGSISHQIGAVAYGKAISVDEGLGVIRAFFGRLVTRNYAPPSGTIDLLHQFFETGRNEDGGQYARELTREFGDKRHLPARPVTPPAAPPSAPAAGGAANQPPPRIQPTPFVLQDPSTLPRREWLYGTHLIRKEISATLAPGGVGKTSLGVAEAVAMATGRPLLGVHVAKPLRVWLWNGEEPQEELMRRLHAVCLRYDITSRDLGDRLLVDNGHDTALVLAEQTRDGTTIREPVVDALVAALKGREVDVMVCDPFVSTHNVTENDNNAIQKAATGWKTVAVRAEVAIGLAHHTRKLNGREATAEDARGADSLIAKCRDARALNPMSFEEACALGIAPADRYELFWTGPGGKSNMAKRTGHKTWFRMVSVGLGNGRGLTEPEDKIGVVESWKPDYSADELATDAIDRLQEIMAGHEWRAADQSVHDPNWIGVAVAEALDIKRDGGPWISEAKKLIRRLEAEGFLKREKAPGEHRKAITVSIFSRPVVEEDDAAEEAA